MVKNKAGQEQVDKLIDELKTSGKTFKYLEWTKQKEQAGNEKADIFRYINAFFINFVTYRDIFGNQSTLDNLHIYTAF